jgi:hypothetical protein
MENLTRVNSYIFKIVLPTPPDTAFRFNISRCGSIDAPIFPDQSAASYEEAKAKARRLSEECQILEDLADSHWMDAPGAVNQALSMANAQAAAS